MLGNILANILDTYRIWRNNMGLKHLDTIEAVFTHYYHTKHWCRSQKESVSGPGSTMRYTETLRSQLPDLIEKYDVKTFLDAPCGDYNWIRHVQWHRPIHYIGADIVGDLIQDLASKYTSESIRFCKLNIVREDLPTVDMWMCRDCLFHFSYDDIWSTLYNYSKSSIPYFLSTVCHNDFNKDILTGSYRYLNLTKAPFNLPDPIDVVSDWIPGHPKRYLYLWTLEQIKKVIQDRR